MPDSLARVFASAIAVTSVPVIRASSSASMGGDYPTIARGVESLRFPTGAPSMILDDLYKSEINFKIATDWDAGWNVSLGNEYGGFVAETSVRTFDEALQNGCAPRRSSTSRLKARRRPRQGVCLETRRATLLEFGHARGPKKPRRELEGCCCHEPPLSSAVLVVYRLGIS
jgi:hypothetical protein